MHTRLSRRTRIALVAGVTVFLTLVGSGSALALWSTSTTVNSTATAATTGLTQTLQAGDPLKVTYASSLASAAGAMTITNTGSRAATYALAILATAPTVVALPGAVVVSAARVATVAACTTTATLSTPTTGVLSTTSAVSPTGTVAAGASVIVCVQTSMTASNVTTYADASLQLSLQSSLTYGTGTGPWTVTATAVTQKQTVASALLFVTDQSGRYNIFANNLCIESYSTTKLVQQGSASCTSYAGQWRLTKDAASGNYYVRQGTNGTSTGSGWSYLSPSAVTVVAAAATAAQRWAVERRADGKYRFRNESTSTCAYLSTTGADGGTNLLLVQLGTCNDTIAAQGFTFTLISTPIPAAPSVMTCGGANGGEYLQYNWTGPATDYQQEVTYTVYVNGVLYPTVGTVPDGFNPYVQFHRSTLPIATYGSGTLTVVAKQSIAGSTPVTVATGTIVVSASTNNLSCT